MQVSDYILLVNLFILVLKPFVFHSQESGKFRDFGFFLRETPSMDLSK